MYEPLIQSHSGLAAILRAPEPNLPQMVRTIIPVHTTGMAAAQALSSALFYKERHGKGQHITLAMLDVMVAYLWPEGSASLSFVGEEGDPSKGQMGLDLVFETKDNKYITAGAVTDQEWLGMCNAFDRKYLLSDPRFNTPRARFDNKTERRLLVAEEIKKHNSDDILIKLHENEVPSAPILTRTELLKNEQIIANEIIEFHESNIFGTIRSPRPEQIYSNTPINGKQ